jgi:hypothetical protein
MRRRRNAARAVLDAPREFHYQRRVQNSPVPSFRWARATLALACVVAVVAPPLGVAADDAGPRAVLTNAEQKLGVVPPGPPVTATFRIDNTGGAPLTLTPGSPMPFVAGVTSTVENAPVPPGGAATVAVRIETEKLAGEGTVRIPITTNDPATPKLELLTTVEVKPLLVADPGYARFNVVQKERDGTIAQKVFSTDGATFKVLSLESPAAALRTSFHEATAEERREGVTGSQWHVDVTLSQDAPVGALTGDVVVVTDHPKQSRVHIPISGFVRPVFAVTPPDADVGSIDGSRPFRFTLDVKNFATETSALERAECDLKGAAVEILPVTEGRAWKVRVSVPEGLPPGPIAGRVRIFTSSAKAPQLDVPVRGRIVEKSSAPVEGK